MKLTSSMYTFGGRPSKRPIAKPQLKFAPARVIRGNEQKCLKCFGIPRLVLRKGITGFQTMDKPYLHLADCPQKGKF